MKQVLSRILTGSLLIAVLLLTAEDQCYAQNLPNEQIQVAIRSALNQMYEIQLDSFSTIPPVSQSASEFTVELTKAIRYDTFPTLLHAALTERDITLPYIVQIRKCGSDSILLAYDRLSFTSASTPCQGREVSESCQMLKIIFRDQEKSSIAVPLILSFTILSLGLLGFIYIRRKESVTISSTEVKQIGPTATYSFILGNSVFYPDNQLLTIQGEDKTLTHRESKLLEYFAKHANEVMKRDDITDAVWKEEGIITGRSLDVFVSRLRKILSADPLVEIKNVHGVGYRLVSGN